MMNSDEALPEQRAVVGATGPIAAEQNAVEASAAQTSMELLNRLFDQALDAGYDAEQSEPSHPARSGAWRFLAFLACLLVGLMVASSALHIGDARPGAAGERDALLQRIDAAEQEHDRLAAQVKQIAAQVEQLRDQDGSRDAQLPADLKVNAAMTPVRGPGVVLTINEGPRRDDARRERSATVLDTDLRMVVNGLWEAGAEAISINGERVSTRTAIRSAGSAITVNYRSLNPPYRIEAIGDPKTLPAAFAASSGGAWLTHLRQNYAVNWTLTTADQLELASDQGLRVSYASPAPK